MLVPFALTLEAILSDVDRKSDRSLAFSRMFEVWLAHGVLVIPRDAVRKASLMDCLSSLPQSSRKRWEYALRKFPNVKRGAEGAYDQNFTTTPVRPPAQRDYELLVLSESQFVCIDECVGSFCGIVDGTEVVINDGFDQASGFKRVKELGTTEISRDASSDDVWNERIAPVARHVSNVAIVDRYALLKFDERGEQSGVFRVLSWLAQLENIMSIDLYSSSIRARVHATKQYDRDLENVMWALSSPLERALGDCQFRGYAIDDSRFARISHDRTMRFDRYCIDIGVGLDVFNAGNVWRDTTFHFRPITLAQPTRRELELKDAARVVVRRPMTA